MISFVLMISACKKEETNGKIIYGTYSVNIEVVHHSWHVPNIPVYLKRNASTFPGPDTSLYEISTIADSDGKASFDKLYPGQYYLFAKGYDYYFGAEVQGASPLNLSNPNAANEPINVTILTGE